jgi:hypothetical protein
MAIAPPACVYHQACKRSPRTGLTIRYQSNVGDNNIKILTYNFNTRNKSELLMFACFFSQPINDDDPSSNRLSKLFGTYYASQGHYNKTIFEILSAISPSMHSFQFRFCYFISLHNC